jgi:hypothetical protein
MAITWCKSRVIRFQRWLSKLRHRCMYSPVKVTVVGLCNRVFECETMFCRRLELRPPYPQTAMLLVVVTSCRAAMVCDMVQSGI